VEITPEYVECPDLLRKEELVFVTFFGGRKFCEDTSSSDITAQNNV
jgi:hypothetical protein